MKAEDFVKALNETDDKYVEETIAYKKSKSSLKIWRAVAIAACAVLAVSAVLATVALTQRSGDDGRYYKTSSDHDSYYYETETAEEKSAALYSSAAANSYESVMYEAEMYDMGYEDAAEEGAFARSLPASGAKEDAALEGIDSDIESEYQPKIIYNIYMEMQTREFDSAVSALEKLIESMGGYSEDQNVSNYTGSYRSAYYTVRVPAENLGAFLDQAGSISTVTYMSRSSKDVSENYYDTRSRLETAKTKLKRLQELLEKAENMEDIITIETAIADTEWEIDNYSGTIRYYDSRVSFSTVTINLNEVYEVITEEAPMSFGEKITGSFSSGLKAFGNFLRNVVIWFASSWLWVVLVIAVVLIITVLIRKIIKKRRKNG